MQKLGQHFLKDPSTLEKIVKALELADGTSIIEIGPGHGELTALLINAAKKGGAAIAVIEKDKALAGQLPKEVEIIEGDALKLLEGTVKHLGKKVYKLVGNIPYYITGKLLRIVSELKHKPERAVFLIQREVAERICAEPPEMNRLAASVQFWAEPKIVGFVSKESFSPPPKVDSAIILLETRRPAQKIDPEKYYEAVRAIFAQPRKTILNNVSAGTTKKMQKSLISASLEENGILPGGRPQDLTVQDVITIAKSLF